MKQISWYNNLLWCGALFHTQRKHNLVYFTKLRSYFPKEEVTGQLADIPTGGQSSHGLVNSWTSQLAKMFDLKFGVYNSSKCHFRQITLFICCQYSIGLELGLGLMCKYSTSNSMIFKNSLVSEIISPLWVGRVRVRVMGRVRVKIGLGVGFGLGL